MTLEKLQAKTNVTIDGIKVRWTLPVLRGVVGKALTFGEWLAGGLLYFTLRSVVGAGVERPRPTITYRDGVSTRDETKD